jgi:hypothetical protein
MSIDFIEYLFQKINGPEYRDRPRRDTRMARGIRQAMPRRRGASGQNT